MSPEKWEEIKNMVGRQFQIEDQGTEDLLVETADGQIKQGEAEFVVFSPGGGSAFGGERLKLQLQKKPKLEDKKYFYSKREGDSARVEYKFSDSELVFTFKVYKWDDSEDDWKEIDGSRLGF